MIIKKNENLQHHLEKQQDLIEKTYKYILIEIWKHTSSTVISEINKDIIIGTTNQENKYKFIEN